MNKNIGFFSAIINSQSYLNLIYLLISFPLGLIYFVFLVTGLSLGFGLFITWIGIPILLGVMFVWLGFAHFERKLTGSMLDIEIICNPEKLTNKKNLWEKLKYRFKDSYTWKSFAYLLIKFPLGLLSFIVLVTFISITLGLIATPFIFHLAESEIIPWVVTGTYCQEGNWCYLNNYPIAILLGLFGIFMIFISLAIFNGLTKVYGILAQSMLSRKTKAIQKKIKRKNKAKKNK